MKKIFLIALIIGLSITVKAQLSYQIDTTKYSYAPGSIVYKGILFTNVLYADSGYGQVTSFYVKIVGCQYPEFELSTGTTIFVPNSEISPNTVEYVYEQVIAWIANKYHN